MQFEIKYGIKYSYLMLTIYEPLYGFKETILI